MVTKTFSKKQIMRAAPAALKARHAKAQGRFDTYLAKFSRAWGAGDKVKADKYRRACVKVQRIIDKCELEAIECFRKKMTK